MAWGTFEGIGAGLDRLDVSCTMVVPPNISRFCCPARKRVARTCTFFGVSSNRLLDGSRLLLLQHLFEPPENQLTIFHHDY